MNIFTSTTPNVVAVIGVVLFLLVGTLWIFFSIFLEGRRNRGNRERIDSNVGAVIGTFTPYTPKPAADDRMTEYVDLAQREQEARMAAEARKQSEALRAAELAQAEARRQSEALRAAELAQADARRQADALRDLNLNVDDALKKLDQGVTDALKAGDNPLELRVVNLWINRQIGDEQLPEDSDRNANGTLKSWPSWIAGGKSSPTGRYTFTSWRLWKKDDPLVESGLLGPVTLSVAAEAPVK